MIYAIDCHLMVTHPQQWVDDFAKAGASGYTFHVECFSELDAMRALCQQIKSLQMRVGIAVKPKTPIVASGFLCQLVDEGLVDMVLIMTVEPGFGGQGFMPECLDKVRFLRARYPQLPIEVDGGLGPKTIDVAAQAGANVIVAGTSVFGAADPGAVIRQLREAVVGAQQ